MKSKPNKRTHRLKIILIIVMLIIVIVAGFSIRGFKNRIDREAAVRQANDPQLQAEREQRVHEHRFISRIAIPTIKVYHQNYQVLPSVVIAQAIVESNWGSSKLYQDAHNPFGIKGRYHGKSIAYDTVEYVRGRKKTVAATFRKYPNLTTAISDHDRTLSNDFIHRKHVTSYVTDAELLQKNHYATDPNYAKKLVNVIKQYHLGKYDLEALND